MSFGGAAAICAALLAASATEDVERAKEYFEAGRKAYERSRYEAAIAAFEEAYKLAPRSGLAFSLAQALRLQFFVDRDPYKLERAVELYRLYLRRSPQGRRRPDAVDHLSTLEPILLRLQQEQRLESLKTERAEQTQVMVSTAIEGARAAIDDGTLREAPLVAQVDPGEHVVRIEAKGYESKEVRVQAVQGRLVVVDGELDELPAELAIETSRGAEVAVSGRIVGTTPLERPLRLSAGRYLVSVRKTGAIPVSQELELARGESQTLKAELRPTTQRKVAWTIVGLSGGLLVAGGVTTGLAIDADTQAQDLSDRVESGPPLTPQERDELAALTSERDDFRLASGLLIGGAVVAGVAGLLLLVLDKPSPAAPQSGIELVPGLSPSARIRF